MLNISKGKIDRAQKVVIYGPEGIGKSSLSAEFPDPVIIDTEGGTAHMDVRRIDKPQSWEELLSISGSTIRFIRSTRAAHSTQCRRREHLKPER
jgi:translation initiation factor RLI1